MNVFDVKMVSDEPYDTSWVRPYTVVLAVICLDKKDTVDTVYPQTRYAPIHDPVHEILHSPVITTVWADSIAVAASCALGSIAKTVADADPSKTLVHASISAMFLGEQINLANDFSGAKELDFA